MAEPIAAYRCTLYHCTIVACCILLTCSIYVTHSSIGKHIYFYSIWDIWYMSQSSFSMWIQWWCPFCDQTNHIWSFLAAGLSLAPLLFLNSLCRMVESLVLLLICSGFSACQSCFSSARWMTPRVSIININSLFVPFQADVVVVLQILLDTSQNTPPAATSTTWWNTSYGVAMGISMSPIVCPSSRNDRST